MRKIKNYILSLSVLLVLAGCSTKSEDVYNKPATFWYESIIKSITSGDLEKADNSFVSLSSEHISSPLLKEAMLILAQAHMDNDEYMLANFYLDEYIKRYGDSKNIEFAKYMKLKANFLSFSNSKRNQKLLLNTIEQMQNYLDTYPNSIYAQNVQTMLSAMKLGEIVLNEDIASYYKRSKQQQAQEFYEQKIEDSDFSDVDMKLAKTNWLRKLFE